MASKAKSNQNTLILFSVYLTLFFSFSFTQSLCLYVTIYLYMDGICDVHKYVCNIIKRIPIYYTHVRTTKGAWLTQLNTKHGKLNSEMQFNAMQCRMLSSFLWLPFTHRVMPHAHIVWSLRNDVQVKVIYADWNI